MEAIKRFIITKPAWVSAVVLLFVCGAVLGWAPGVAAVAWMAASTAVLIWRHRARTRISVTSTGVSMPLAGPPVSPGQPLSAWSPTPPPPPVAAPTSAFDTGGWSPLMTPPTAPPAVADPVIGFDDADHAAYLGAAAPRLWPAVIEAWGRRNVEFEVEDEADHRRQVGAIVAAQGVRLDPHDERGIELWNIDGVLATSDVDGEIVVVLDDVPVGRMGADSAPAYRHVVEQADANRTHVPLRARVWAINDNGVVRSRVTIWLPDPTAIHPPKPIEAHQVLLPKGRTVQITGEENHIDALAGILDGLPSVSAVATLSEVPPTAPATKSRVSVQIDGHDVGRLTPAMSDHFLPIVRALATTGRTAACRATVSGNSLKADVVLDAARSVDLSPEWVQEHVGVRA